MRSRVAGLLRNVARLVNVSGGNVADLPTRCEVVRYVLDDNLLAVAETVLTRAAGVDGLFADPLLPQREALALRGCEPFAEAPDTDRYADFLRMFDDHGDPFAEIPIALEVTSTRPSALGPGLVDVVLDQHSEVRDSFIDLVELLRLHRINVELESTLDGVVDLGRRTALTALVRRWNEGWTKAAGLTSRPDHASIRVQVGEPRCHEEWIVTDDAPDRIRWVTERVAGSRQAAWLNVPTHSPGEVTAAVREAGLVVRAPETFMRRALADHPAPPAPDGYEISVVRGDRVEVRVLADGVEAASGAVAIVGEDAVPRRIETALEHRRRGLGSVVMGVLMREALEAGATTGLLFASDDGLHLYRRLGWETIADVVIAHNAVPEEA